MSNVFQDNNNKERFYQLTINIFIGQENVSSSCIKVAQLNAIKT